MATTLGKRKRRTPTAIEDEQSSDSEDSGSLELDAQEIFRRHFEARFKPLPTVQKSVQVAGETPDSDSEEDSEWSGISDEEDTAVQVVEHVNVQSQIATMSKEEIKEFMVSFLPRILDHT